MLPVIRRLTQEGSNEESYQAFTIKQKINEKSSTCTVICTVIYFITMKINLCISYVLSKKCSMITAPPVQKPYHLKNFNQKLKLISRLR